MHIAIDLRIVDRPGMEATGVGRYAIESTRALLAVRPKWRFTVHTQRPALLASGTTTRSTRWPTESSAGRVAWLHAGACMSALHERPDVWVGTAFTLPWWWRGPAVVTVHDLVFLDFPSSYSGRLNAAYASRATRSAVRRASFVVTGSKETRDRLERRLGVSRDRVLVSPYGVADALVPSSLPAADSRESFILHVGTLEPRKGLDDLRLAMKRLNADRPVPVPLVLAGRRGWGDSDLLPRLIAEPYVTWIDGPSDETLARLYRSAALLACSSHAEGFGLPVAEALVNGCPVVCTDLPSIREFAGAVPRYVPPRNPEALAVALAELLNDPAALGRHAINRPELFQHLRWSRVGDDIARAIETRCLSPSLS